MVGLVWLGSGCRRDLPTPAPAAAWVADATCASCHAEEAAEHAQSAHRWTSSRSDEGRLRGAFSTPDNVMATGSEVLRFVMNEEGGSPTLTAEWNLAGGKVERRQERFDVVVGSGRKGQTSLFWRGDELFELPVSWWAATDAWMNSPGYVDGTARFDRGSSDRCLECHATGFESRGPPRNRFDPASLVLGISCSKCHGPGAAHVAAVKAGATDLAIVNPAKLSRARQLDLCAWCHGGRGESLTPPQSFRPGEVLAAHLKLDPPPVDGDLDPHGSQLQGLVRSACFRESGTLTCGTCHDGHAQQREPAAYAADCQSCHEVVSPTGAHAAAEAMTRCVDCHMPLQPTNKIILRAGGREHRPLVRNHTIAVYPADSVSP